MYNSILGQYPSCNTSSLHRVLRCMVGVLNVGMDTSLPPNALFFNSSSVAREKVLPVHHLKITLNLWTTSANIKWGIRVSRDTLMQEAGARVHASCMPHPANYAPLILTMKTSQRYCCYLVCESDNCYQFKTFALLMYSRGVSPRIPSNPMKSPRPCGICLHGLILISQSVTHLPASQSALCLPSQPISILSLIRPHPLWTA